MIQILGFPHFVAIMVFPSLLPLGGFPTAMHLEALVVEICICAGSSLCASWEAEITNPYIWRSLCMYMLLSTNLSSSVCVRCPPPSGCLHRLRSPPSGTWTGSHAHLQSLTHLQSLAHIQSIEHFQPLAQLVTYIFKVT